MPKRSIPDRWIKYDPIGAQIPGTRFIAIKVPLRDYIQSSVPTEKRLTTSDLLERVPNLGLIIDLTNTRRYYRKEDFTKEGISHIQISVPGHHVPDDRLVNRFKLDVLSFLNKNTDNDKLIGVHCTHGVNRTGFMICHFMITELCKKPSDAIETFRIARGYDIERENYKAALYSLGNEKYGVDLKKIQEIRVSRRRHAAADIRTAPPIKPKLKTNSNNEQTSLRESRDIISNWRDHPPVTYDEVRNDRKKYERRNTERRNTEYSNWRTDDRTHIEKRVCGSGPRHRTSNDRSRTTTERNDINGNVSGAGTSRGPRIIDSRQPAPLPSWSAIHPISHKSHK